MLAPLLLLFFLHLLMRKSRGKPLMTIAPHQVTRLLQEWNDGDEGALEQLMPLVHTELHRLAHQHMRREGPGHILQTSALISEAYLRLVDQPQIRWENRNHCFGIAARLMRRIVVDDARKRNSAKRGRSLIHVPLDEATSVVQEQAASYSTVMLDWTFARAWLRNEMSGS